MKEIIQLEFSSAKQISPIRWHENKEDLKKHISNIFSKYTQVVCVTDENIHKAQLNFFDILDIPVIQITAGEKNKKIDTVLKITEQMAEHEMDRNSLLVGIGGGVVTDMTAFSASIYQRGIDVLLIPTSLLAIVDAAIGGKTGVDTSYGKNQLGTFYWPVSVEICPEFLETLPSEELNNGIAEMLKHGIIASEKHFSALGKIINQDFAWNDLVPLIGDSVAIKSKIVTQDAREKSGERIKLNLGHTFGHAIETLSDYKTPHGEAVAQGLIFAAEHSLSLNKTTPETVEQIRNVVLKLFPQECPYSSKEIWNLFGTDKKRSGKTISLVLPEKIGSVFVYEAALES